MKRSLVPYVPSLPTFFSNGKSPNGDGIPEYLPPSAKEEIVKARDFMGIRAVAYRLPSRPHIPYGLLAPVPGPGLEQLVFSYESRHLEKQGPARLDWLLGVVPTSAILVDQYRVFARPFLDNIARVRRGAHPKHLEFLDTFKNYVLTDDFQKPADYVQGTRIIGWGPAYPLLTHVKGTELSNGGKVWLYPELGNALKSVMTQTPLNFSPIAADSCPVRYAAPRNKGILWKNWGYVDLQRNQAFTYYAGELDLEYQEYLKQLLVEGSLLFLGANHQERLYSRTFLLRVQVPWYEHDPTMTLDLFTEKANTLDTLGGGSFRQLLDTTLIEDVYKQFIPGSAQKIELYFHQIPVFSTMFEIFASKLVRRGDNRSGIFVGWLDGSQLFLDLWTKPFLVTAATKTGKTLWVSILVKEMTKFIFWFPLSKVDKDDAPPFWIQDMGGELVKLKLKSPDNMLVGITKVEHLDSLKLRDRLHKELRLTGESVDAIIDEVIQGLKVAWIDGDQHGNGKKAAKRKLLDYLLVVDEEMAKNLILEHVIEYFRTGEIATVPKYFDPGFSFLPRVYTVYQIYALLFGQFWKSIGKKAVLVWDNVVAPCRIGDSHPTYKGMLRAIADDLLDTIFEGVGHGVNRQYTSVVIGESVSALNERDPSYYEAFPIHLRLTEMAGQRMMQIVVPQEFNSSGAVFADNVDIDLTEHWDLKKDHMRQDERRERFPSEMEEELRQELMELVDDRAEELVDGDQRMLAERLAISFSQRLAHEGQEVVNDPEELLRILIDSIHLENIQEGDSEVEKQSTEEEE